MKLLAISDIHNNVVAVRKMRSHERNSFDAIIVAGDIGSYNATKIMGILSTFKCPVLYVYGNWDSKLSYKTAFGTKCHLIHLNITSVGDFHFTGFSGCPTNWGRNPIAARLFSSVERANESIIQAYAHAEAKWRKYPETVDIERLLNRITGTRAYQKYEAQKDAANKRALQLHRQHLTSVFRRAKIDPRKTIVVTHERLYRLDDAVPSALLHTFGHIHQFSVHEFKDTTFMNVSALDKIIYARPRGKRKSTDADCRNVNAGSYTIIEIQNDGNISAQRVSLPHNYKRWIPLERVTLFAEQLIPEEADLTWLF